MSGGAEMRTGSGMMASSASGSRVISGSKSGSSYKQNLTAEDAKTQTAGAARPQSNTSLKKAASSNSAMMDKQPSSQVGTVPSAHFTRCRPICAISPVLYLYCIKGALALFVLVSFSGYVC